MAAEARRRRDDLRSCRRIIRVHARSFSFAALFLPGQVREDVAVVYAYYRMLDDLVDEPPEGMGRERVRAVLDDWDAWLAAGLPADGSHPVRRILPEVVERRRLHAGDLRIVIRGLRSDLDHRRPATMAELEGYCFDVAGSVGLVMAGLLGARDPEAARDAAAALGSAMQLTNVCRDVDEDLRRGRVYLPTDVCALAGCDDSALLDRRATPGVRLAVAVVARRAAELYARGMTGLPLLPREARFPIAVAARTYAAILDRLAARRHDVFAGRVSTTRRHKWALAARLAAARTLRG
ncbi:MAG: 15-cis-phytoene synthase [Chloroflexota bacterium]|jgi:phytoene synthase|nr:15-cis-phytoene synthase [Chloroflexota bacterium]